MIITPEERKAINELKRVSKRWPSSLWLYSANGELHIMKKGDQGEHAVLSHGGLDPDYSVGTVPIENDGGDW